MEPPLAIQKRPEAEIKAIQPEEIERIATWFAPVCHEIVEVRAAFLIQHYDLAVQDHTLPFQTPQDLIKKRIKLMELLSLARHQPGVVAVDIQDPAKAVVVQLVDPVGMADWLLHGSQRRWGDLGQHRLSSFY